MDKQNKSQNDVNSLFESLFENSKILTIVDDNDGIWFKAKDVAAVLGYKDRKDCIREHVDEGDKMAFSKIKSCPNFSRASQFMGGKKSPTKITYQTHFINESGVNSLILGSQKPIAKRFQKWLTSEVIPSIRLKGKYVHKEHKPKKFIEDNIPTFTGKSVLSDNNVKSYLEQYHNNAKIDVPDFDSLHKLIKDTNINIQFFDKKHVLYYFITSITNLRDNRIIIKFGYTADLLERYPSLQKEYDCKFVLVGVKIINSQQDEKQFHRLLKSKYSELNYKIKVGDKHKDELYYFDDRLTEEFFNFRPSKAQVTDKKIELAKYKAIEAYNIRLAKEKEIRILELKIVLAKLAQ